MKISRDHGDGRFERNEHFFLQTKSVSQNKFRVLRINRNHDK